MIIMIMKLLWVVKFFLATASHLIAFRATIKMYHVHALAADSQLPSALWAAVL